MILYKYIGLKKSTCTYPLNINAYYRENTFTPHSGQIVYLNAFVYKHYLNNNKRILNSLPPKQKFECTMYIKIICFAVKSIFLTFILLNERLRYKSLQTSRISLAP